MRKVWKLLEVSSFISEYCIQFDNYLKIGRLLKNKGWITIMVI